MGLFLLALTLGLLAFAGQSIFSTVQDSLSKEKKNRPARERIFAVNVITAQKVTVEPIIATFGEVQSRRRLDLRAPRGGTIVELSENFVDGGQVKTGELLLRLDPADAQSALDVAQTELTEALAEKKEANNDLTLAEDELKAARQQAQLRETALKRRQDLLERGAGTDTAVETATLALSSAEQGILGKRKALAQANARINRALTQLDRREIRLKEAQRRLADTVVLAKFDGVLSGVNAVRGGLVSPNEKLGALIDPTALEASFRISNAHFTRLIDSGGKLVRRPVVISLDLLGAEYTATGTIDRVGAEVGDGLTGRKIFARLPPDQTAALRPGDFVTVSIVEPALTGVVVLPALAVNAQGTVLVLGDSDRLQEAEVTVLRKQKDDLIVRADAILGREIVVARSPLLGEGIRVKPLRNDADAAPEDPEMVELTAERRAKLVAFIEANPVMPQAVKDRVLGRLNQPKVPVRMVERIEARMGG